jgi:ABC-type branched-subunit amino acid transport system permease subunit
MYELLIYGVIIVIIIRFTPEGLIGLPRIVFSWFGQPSKKE